MGWPSGFTCGSLRLVSIPVVTVPADRGIRPGVTTAESVDLAAARRRIRELGTELAVTNRANELLKEQTDPRGGSRPSRARLLHSCPSARHRSVWES